MTENPHAGKGSAVLLDIGGSVGALVITMPPSLADHEIELRPAGATHSHNHVAVVPRRSPDGQIIHSAVFFEVQEGTYDLYIRPDGPIQLTATITGGSVTEAHWPQ